MVEKFGRALKACSLRKAELSDAEAMASVHVRCWQETYKGLLDNRLINEFNFDNRKKMWTAFLQKNDCTQKAYVAVHNNKIIGITSWNETAEDLELLTLYVLYEFHAQGVGKCLFTEVEKDAVQRRKRLVTWVLKDNKATFFYEKRGLRFVKIEEKRLGSSVVSEVMYASSFTDKN